MQVGCEKLRLRPFSSKYHQLSTCYFYQEKRKELSNYYIYTH